MCFEKNSLNVTRANENNFWMEKPKETDRRERRSKPINLFECHGFMDFKLIYCHFTFLPINYVLKCHKYQLQSMIRTTDDLGWVLTTTFHLLNFSKRKRGKKRSFIWNAHPNWLSPITIVRPDYLVPHLLLDEKRTMVNTTHTFWKKRKIHKRNHHVNSQTLS